MNQASSADVPAGEATIIVRRTVDAPRELVWKVWTDPVHIAKWWGPNGFTNTVHSMDVRPGGAWLYIMHGPDGMNFDTRVDYLEVVKPERLVYNLAGVDAAVDPHHFRVVVTFTDNGGKTDVVMHSTFPSVEARNAVLKFGAVEGGKQNLDRLAVYLETVKV